MVGGWGVLVGGGGIGGRMGEEWGGGGFSMVRGGCCWRGYT